jgi:dTMP kinase
VIRTMFITFEGPDGCGKTTQLTLLKEHLTRQGYSVYVTREPGGTKIGEQIRAILHDPLNEEMIPHAEILLYSASRAQLVTQVIRPALAKGQIVLSDRFYDSTFAYQGYGRGLDLDALRRITRFATGGLRPDLTIYLEIDPQLGLSRRQEDKNAEWNRLDALALEFHERVHAGYQALIAAEPERWVVVNGQRPVAQVQADVQAAVMARLAAS